MISIPAQETGRALTPWQCLAQGLPRAYAILFFSADARLGWMLLTISLLAPDVGLCGLAGVLAAGTLALVLGFDRARVRNGYFLFNPLLVCLTVGWMNRSYDFPWPTFLTLWIAAVLGGFFIALALQQWVGQQFGLSPQSLPATGVAYLLYFLAYTTSGPAAPPVPGPSHGWPRFRRAGLRLAPRRFRRLRFLHRRRRHDEPPRFFVQSRQRHLVRVQLPALWHRARHLLFRADPHQRAARLRWRVPLRADGARRFLRATFLRPAGQRAAL
jgi:hypothetical protein